MEDLLTTRQLQQLLQVDRVTIYRMLSDGRLQGLKVGGQWRFSRPEIEAWLHGRHTQHQVHDEDPEIPEDAGTLPHALSPSCVQAIQGICAEAMEIAAVTLRPDGTSLGDIRNSCRFCSLILDTPEGSRRCREAWMAQNGQVQVCHAGLYSVSTPIRLRGQTIGISALCQFVPDQYQAGGTAWRCRISALAEELGLSAPELEAAADSVRLVSVEEMARIGAMSRRMANAFSEIGQERLHLLSRLQHIAEISQV